VGLGDKLKDLTKQAQDAVAEHRDQIHEAVDAASVAADRKTRGKHTARIAKLGQKAGNAVDRFAGGGEEQGTPPADASPSTAEAPHTPPAARPEER
jgi:riboflavin synthase